eukprot:TRINITY_DN33598_c0_g1_i1.p1 TRINITY_DN33598_c0_g1~~TRINITY_DN33598_c0_g1_i1.p1  ORF type:complete len:809 (+),score=155.28 TRINITY_DN33598_c0_g1_i1:113-2539(+)
MDVAAAVDEAEPPPATDATGAHFEKDFQRFLAEQLCGLHDTMVWKYEALSKAMEQKHGQFAEAAEGERVALTQELERLQRVLKSVVDAPPAPTDSTVAPEDDLRKNLTAPAWDAPAEPAEPAEMPAEMHMAVPLPGAAPEELSEAADKAADPQPEVPHVPRSSGEPSVRTVAIPAEQSSDVAPTQAAEFQIVGGVANVRVSRDEDALPLKQNCSDSFRRLLSVRSAPERLNDPMVRAVARGASEPPSKTTAGVGAEPPAGTSWSAKVEALLTEAMTMLHTEAASGVESTSAASMQATKRKRSKEMAMRAMRDEELGSRSSREAPRRGDRASEGRSSPHGYLARSNQKSDLSELMEASDNQAMLRSIRRSAEKAAFENSFVQGFQRAPPPVSGCLADVVCSRCFDLLCSIVITANAVFIAYATNYGMQNLDEKSTFLLDVFEFLFCSFYTLELVVRLIVYSHYYFYSNEWAWNTFDALLVLVSLQEMLMQFLPIDSTGLNMSFLRILRVMKMVRLFRVVRLMRMFRELRLIWNSIFGCVKAIFWAMVLIISVSFMVGVCIVQASTAFLREFSSTLTPEEVESIKDSWGSVQTATLTLYQSVTGGNNWADIATVLWPVGTPYYVLFLLYILFYTCVICNTITSLFVESTMVNADRDHQVVIQNALENTEEYIEKLRGWFSSVDSDGNGCVTFDEFCDKLQDPEAMAFASTLNIELTDLKQFFAGLSHNGARTVNLETFVVGCIRMRGPAKSMDLLELIFHEREAAAESRLQLNEFEDFCRNELRSLRYSWERYLAEEGHGAMSEELMCLA